jgi:hypothetical protein
MHVATFAILHAHEEKTFLYPINQTYFVLETASVTRGGFVF